jgi:predicted tellurium resistance membrane protein TerC
MNFQADLQALLSLHGLISLCILALLELVLGVDNIIFISLLIAKIPEERRFNARITGLSLAFVMRIIMLFCLVWLSRISTTLFSISVFQVSIKDILFFIGGAYLMVSTIRELVNHLYSKTEDNTPKQPIYKSIILQIVVVDVLFSFDSIFTAIGIIPNLIIMGLAVGLGMVFMIYLSGQTSKFIEKNPSVKTIALCFIIAVGLMLVTEAFHFEVPKEYLYVAFGAAFVLERAYHYFKKS